MESWGQRAHTFLSALDPRYQITARAGWAASPLAATSEQPGSAPSLAPRGDFVFYFTPRILGGRPSAWDPGPPEGGLPPTLLPGPALPSEAGPVAHMYLGGP